MEMLRRIVYLTFRPNAEWTRIAGEQVDVDTLLRRYIIPLSLPTALATYVGMKVFDATWDIDHGYLVPQDQIFATAAFTFFALVGSILLLGGILSRMAHFYDARPSYVDGLKVAAYGATPLLVTGAGLVLPDMVVVSMIGLCHSLFLVYVGAGTVLGVRAEKAEFLCISLVILALGSMLFGAAVATSGIV